MQIAASKFQLNTHAIGDSASDFEDLQQTLAGTKDRRWKIETPKCCEVDFDYFKFYSSVQYSCYIRYVLG
jgi:hypothetical protein